MIRLGTSGWSYGDRTGWVDLFYLSKDTPRLAFYSKFFSTVEIDSTFYSFPTKMMVLGWVRNSPANFVFSAKLPQVITHEKRLNLEKGVEIDLAKFLTLLEPMQRAGKLGVILVQLPPSFGKGKMRLTRFLEILSADYKWAIEFRNPSWWSDDTWSLLRKFKVANTLVDEPLLPPDIIETAPHTFIRWHGHGSDPWYNYRYSENELRPWAGKIQGLETKGIEVYGYFNNHFYAYAVENCLHVLEMLGSATEEHKEMLSRIGKIRSGEIGQKKLTDLF